MINIVNIDSVGIPHLAIDSSSILNVYQTYMNTYNDDSINLEYNTDSLHFDWFFKLFIILFFLIYYFTL